MMGPLKTINIKLEIYTGTKWSFTFHKDRTKMKPLHLKWDSSGIPLSVNGKTEPL